jgi:hypothetical protein
VVNAADGTQIDFSAITTSSKIILVGGDLPNDLTAAENAAVAALGGPGVVHFNDIGGNEYFIATNHAETAVSSTDAIVKLVGVHDLEQPSSASGLVTLHF